MSLSDKQKAFVREYLIDHNGTQAAIRAGYSPKTARQQAEQLLKDERIDALVKEGESELEERATLTKLDKLKIAEEIIVDREKERTTDRLKALEIHNKMLGHNDPDKIEHSGSGTIFNVKIDED